MRWRIEPSRIAGPAAVPGDKSIAHRALMLAALAPGRSSIRNLPGGADVSATAACMAALGAAVDRSDGVTAVESAGALSAPAVPLDAMNSGTTMRLLAGLLAGQPFASCLVGDASLSKRPMSRVVEPLSLMGARIRSNAGRAPLEIDGTPLHGVSYTLPVASAQVKSALLLAGLFAQGATAVTEPVLTRDHTERMLTALGIPVLRSNGAVSVSGGLRPAPFSLCVPGDVSSAAFLFAGAVLTGGEVVVEGLGLNPYRTGFLQVLDRMGAEVQISNVAEEMGEPVGTVRVCGAVTEPIEICADEVPSLVDEIPLVALLATQAPGESVIRGAAELRVKETDRIAGVVRPLGAMGALIEGQPDGFAIRGPTRLRGTAVSSGGDHRLAMMLSVAGAIAEGETVLEGAEAVSVSYPGFAETFRALGGQLDA